METKTLTPTDVRRRLLEDVATSRVRHENHTWKLHAEGVWATASRAALNGLKELRQHGLIQVRPDGWVEMTLDGKMTQARWER